jgi:ketosteroid isomerase-like protein
VVGRSIAALLTVVLTLAAEALPGAQQAPELPQPLTQMIETERAFAARALIVGWKAAFLEYFADNAVGFDQGRAGLARDQIVANPDPPKDHRLIWEPRYGDVAASGDLGYLTGPVRSILPSRDNGRPRHSTYTSIWKRERNGAFKVVMDVGTNTPSPVPFAAGFTRAASADRFTGDYDDTTPPLSAADGVLNSALRSGQAAAYRGRLAAGVRFHRPNLLPVVGERTATRWLATQPAYTVADSRYSEAARSGDLGYTWGAYAIGPRQKPTQQGFYVRVWERERKGQWKIAMDILQPQ